ncbi:MAG: YqaJ viral recombinase family protein [Lachnospiraceae bacterium]|nr:YqaJ viral recombinase family protein [Lachnospiraceae bacterium]
MCTTISTASMSREDWLRLRKSGIGGSDAGAICGLNPYASPMSVYRDKTSEDVSDTDNEAMRQGRDLEDYVARRFMEATGLKVRRSNMMYRSDDHPCMIADVDRLVVGEDAGLECKTASAYNADKWKDGEVPMHYLIQCCHYMAVTGKTAWYIAVVILGQEFKFTKITRDDALIANLIAIEEAFWNNHIIPRIILPPDGSKACDEVLEQYFHRARKDSAIPLIGFDEKLNRRSELLGQIKELEQEQQQIEQEVKLFMQDNEIAASKNYRVTWSNVNTTRLDTKRIKDEEPEIYQNFVKVTSSRRLTIKTAS